MKQLLTVVQGKKFLLSIAMSLIGIWCVGPFVAIAGNTIFETLTSRILASLIVFLFFFTLEYQRSLKFFINSSLPDELRQELELLKKGLRSAKQALHANAIKAFFFRYKHPWYLVLGPSNAGKSTLLNHADLNIRGLDNLPPMSITPTKYFNWWLADEAVFIDVGGRYLRDRDTPSHKETLFQEFFKLLKRYRRHKPIDGLILPINLQELTINTKEQFQLNALKAIINRLVIECVDFPIYLILTRCDAIEGFVEFFEDLGPAERNQIFGIHFPMTETSSLPQLFNDEYDALLKRLNENIIHRLHKEQNLDKISKIKNFPLQIEMLKHPLAKLLNVILPTTHLNLRGIFFTSALQKDIPYDNLLNTLSRAYDIYPSKGSPRTSTSKNFFIQQIFKRIIFHESKFHATNSHHRLQLITNFSVISITALCLFLFFKSYLYNLQTIHRTQEIIRHIDIANLTSDDKLLYHLNSLHDMISVLSQREEPWYTKMGLQQTHAIHSKAQKIYQSLLQHEFMDYLQRTLEIQLHNTPEDVNQIYAALKAYLMLGEIHRLDRKFFSLWFNHYWQQLNGDDGKTQYLNQHLSALLKCSFKGRALDTQLIDEKRRILNTMPPSRLILTILQNKYQRSPVKLLLPNQALAFNDLPSEIPGIYNILNFKDVYYQEIPRACQDISRGDWVLGKNGRPVSDILLNQLSNEVKAIYLNEYAVIWNRVLAKIKIEDYKNLNQMIAMLDLLNDSQSPLIALINIIKNNTQPISDSIEFTQQVSARFLGLENLSSTLLKNTHQPYILAIKNYLVSITQAPDVDKASYEAAKKRMEMQTNDEITTLLSQARTLPEPLRTWHTALGAESWRLILQNTQRYLNKIWTTTVYPQYVSLLDKRYPLFKDSNIDISLNNFSQFFGNGGIMDMFFQQYLQPFVDNSRLYWEWRNVDGQRLNISQATLEMFIRGALIQKMFFPDNATTPSITFSLVPVELDPNLQSFSLNLEGQSLLFQKDNEQIISLTWPGPTPNHSDLLFVDTQGKKFNLEESGPWSWFRLLDKCILENTNSPKHFRLTFQLNGKAAHYELYTIGIVNPFIPGIISVFRCPPVL